MQPRRLGREERGQEADLQPDVSGAVLVAYPSLQQAPAMPGGGMVLLRYGGCLKILQHRDMSGASRHALT